MERDVLIRELDSRGGEADVWLVYVVDALEHVQGGPASLVLQRAFWTRGGAYAFAEGSRVARAWQHYYVWRLRARAEWAATNVTCPAEFEAAFGRARALPDVGVTPAELARALG